MQRVREGWFAACRSSGQVPAASARMLLDTGRDVPDEFAKQHDAARVAAPGSVVYQRLGTMSSGYRQIDHTADLALEIWATSEEELLRVAARAVVDVLTDAAPIPATDSRYISLNAVDAEDRLVQWLNEVIVAAVVDGFVVADAAITLQGSGLSAEMRGQAGAEDRIVTELKSATYHDLAISHGKDGWRAHVVIDV